jgi:hypothetical protein
MRTKFLLAVLAGSVVACSDSIVPTTSSSARSPEPTATPSFARTSDGVPIPGEYIVRFRDNDDPDARRQLLARLIDGSVERTYRSAIKGLFIRGLSNAAVAALRADPNVLTVEQNYTISLATTQTGATWGIDRIDQRALPLSTTYNYNNDGTGVTVYIIDTGINYTHNEYSGRAFFGVDEIIPSTNGLDCNGHGSHVSGTVGGTTYGVAKKVKLVAVRVLSCAGSGSTAGVVAGIDWVTANRVLPAAANMSLGGGFSATLNAAVTNSIAAGVTYGIAAGNSAADACNSSPSSTPNAVTVGATDITDHWASFSNFGPCVDIDAPGVNITSAWMGSNTATNTISGTSMATPHVVGAAALYLQSNPSATPAQVAAALTSNATNGTIIGVPNGTVNKLLYMGFIGGGTNAPPVAKFTVTCPTLQCTFDASTSTDDVGIVSYTWTWGDGRSETRSGPIAKNTYSAAGTYNVTLTVKDAGNLTGSVTKPVTVPNAVQNQPPTASITSPTNGASFVQGASVSFAGSGNDPEDGALTGSSLTWTSSIDGAIGTGTSFSKSNLSVGAHTITLTATDSKGATGSTNVSITITPAGGGNQPPVAAFTFNCVGQAFPHQCTFDASGSTDDVGIVSYTWAWGDGRVETKPVSNAKNTWTGTGTFNVTLTVKDGGGLTNSITKAVAVP